jgi:hypothetical protein
MLHTIISSLRKLRPASVALGRWARTEKTLNDVKVDLANMDHCGTCAHDKIQTPDEKKIKPITVNKVEKYLK